jgi:cysteinyl-tRNA synthetase
LAMNDDFNTPEALSELFGLAHEINRVRDSDPQQAARLAGLLKALGGILGILQTDPQDYLQAAPAVAGDLTAEQIEDLLAQRITARQQRNWAESDRIRDMLKERGVLLEDGAQGTTWRRA